MDGFADLGSLLAGEGKQIYAQEFERSMSRRQQTDLAMTKARIARDEEIARGEQEAALGAFMDPQMAKVITVTNRAGWNPGQTTKAILDADRRKNAMMAAEAMKSGDFELGQMFMALAQGKAPTRTAIVGDTAYNPALSPDQALYATPKGGSVIEANMARADASRAQAGSSNARANLYGRTDPNAAKTKPAPQVAAPAVNIRPSEIPAVQDDRVARLQAAAQRAIANGKDPAAVEALLAQKLAELGL